MTEHNVKITRATLGLEDHGIPTSYLICEWNSSGQGFGGYDLSHRNAMCNWVQGIQRVLGVEDWSKVAGQFCRIRRDDTYIVAIGHIVDERWFTKDDIYDKDTPT